MIRIPFSFSLALLCSACLFFALSSSLQFPIPSPSPDVCAGSTPENPILHLVVLMMENRSFDHFLGWLKQLNPEIRGLTGNESNLADPSDPTSQRFFVNQLAQNVDPDFDHSVPGTSREIQWASLGNPSLSSAPMDGFVAQNNLHVPSQGPLSLAMFNSSTLPVLSSLALSFSVFDAYFADLPGPTMPNRFFFMSGTSHGLANNDDLPIAIGLPQRSLFDRLNDWKVSWRVYSESAPTVLGLRRMRHPANLARMRDLRAYASDLANLTLPSFAWVEPSYFAVPEEDLLATDQHPEHPVDYGEQLIKDVYEQLRNSQYWPCSALLVTYDEHGGFADFAPTPLKGVPSPDGLNSTDPPFDFQRLGLRVPFVIASPWIDASTVVHEPPAQEMPTNTSQFSHSSLAATLQRMFDPSGEPLTNRTAWAAPFDFVWRRRSAPRTDAPAELPPVYKPQFYRGKARHGSAGLQMNEFQKQLVAIARQMCADDPVRCGMEEGVPAQEEIGKYTEGEGGRFVLRVLRALNPEWKSKN